VRRILVILSVLVVAMAIALWLKVVEEDAIAGQPPGGSGVIEGLAIDVSARMSSRIVAVNAKEGDKVKAGQVLVELECSEPTAALEAARARVLAAESGALAASAQVEAALGAAQAAKASAVATGAQRAAVDASRSLSSKQNARVKKLEQSGAINAGEVDRAEGQLLQLTEQLRAVEAQGAAATSQAAAARAQAEAARGQAASARATIAAANADVRRMEALVKECQLVAPRDAIVETRALEPGEAVLPGTRVLRLMVLDPVETTFYLPNAELAMVRPGGAVRVIADAIPDRVFAGTVAWVSPEAEFTPRNVQTRRDRDRLVYAVRITLTNPDAALRAGMPVEVTVAP